MTKAKADDAILTIVDVPSHFGDRTIPAGTEGVVLEVNPSGTYLVDVTLEPAAPGKNGDYDQATLTDDQFEIIPTETSGSTPG